MESYRRVRTTSEPLCTHDYIEQVHPQLPKSKSMSSGLDVRTSPHQEVDDINHIVSKIVNENQCLENNFTKLKHNNVVLQSRRKEMAKDVHHLQSRLMEASSQIKELESNASEDKASKERLQKLVVSMRQFIAETERELDNYQQKLTVADEDKRAAQQNLSLVAAKLQDILGKEKELKTTIFDLETSIKRLKEEKERVQEVANQRGQHVQQLNIQIEEQRKNAEKNNVTMSKMNEELEKRQWPPRFYQHTDDSDYQKLKQDHNILIHEHNAKIYTLEQCKKEEEALKNEVRNTAPPPPHKHAHTDTKKIKDN